jgi:hypothetical protein
VKNLIKRLNIQPLYESVKLRFGLIGTLLSKTPNPWVGLINE